MTTTANTKKLIDNQIADLEALLDRLYEERKSLDIPKEPHDGAAIRFQIRWREGDRTYTYIALSVDGEWHLTGGSIRQTFTWPELIRWMRAGFWHSPVRIMDYDFGVPPVLDAEARD